MKMVVKGESVVQTWVDGGECRFGKKVEEKRRRRLRRSEEVG